MIVVDTNIVAYLTLPGSLSDAARHLFRSDPQWSAPALWRSEFRNLLTGYLRRRTLTVSQASDLMRQAGAVVSDSVAVESEMVFELVSASRCTAYDCEFVALALDLEVPLITADRKVLAAFPRIAMPLSD